MESITSIAEFELGGRNYKNVLKMDIEDENIDLDEMGIAQDIGFIYLKINNQLFEIIP